MSFRNSRSAILRFYVTLVLCLSSIPAFSAVLYEGISYSRGLKLDIHAPEKVKRAGIFSLVGNSRLAPVVLYVHGGGWVKGSRKKVYKLPDWLTSKGYLLVAIDYRKVPRTTIDGQVKDVSAAIRWVRSRIRKYGGDPKRIVIMGHSAGAHLVSMVAAKRKGGALRGVIPNDVQAYDVVAYAGMRGSLGYPYSNAFGSNPRNWVRWSPATWARRSSGLPPHLVMYSGSQRERRRSISIGYANLLKSRGTRVSVFHGGRYTHGSIARKLGSPGDKATKAVEKFLRRVMR